MTIQARMRRLQDTLSVVGTGIIALNAWTLAKMTLLFLLYSEEAQRKMFGISDDLSMEVYYITFAIIAVLDMAVHVYVGLSARAEGRGKKKGSVYLVLAALIAAMSVLGIVLVVQGVAASPSLFDMLMSVVFEITLIVTLVLMIFCAVRLRRLKKMEG